MHISESFDLGDYSAVPIVEGSGSSEWRAGVLLSAGDPRGDRPAKGLYPQRFPSPEDAMRFARGECARQASQLNAA